MAQAVGAERGVRNVAEGGACLLWKVKGPTRGECNVQTATIHAACAAVCVWRVEGAGVFWSGVAPTNQSNKDLNKECRRNAV